MQLALFMSQSHEATVNVKVFGAGTLSTKSSDFGSCEHVLLVLRFAGDRAKQHIAALMKMFQCMVD